MKRRTYDISLPLTTQTKVFPGDAPLHYNFMQQISKGDGLNLSEFSATAHIGTHADAPLHYLDGKKSIGEVDLDIFMGVCQLIKLNVDLKSPVMPNELAAYPDLTERILLCTTADNKYNEWTNDYRPLSVELIDYLHTKGVKLIGVDTPSIDEVNSTDAAAHKRIFKYEMIILENLYLNQAPEGKYELMALPLKFMELEASPVRAILRTL